MQTSSSNMTHAMEESQKRVDKILVIKQDNIASIGKRLHDIVESCIEIDIKNGSA